MNKIAGLGLSALMAATLMIPVTTQNADAAGGRNRAFAAGAVLGLLAAGAVASSAQANAQQSSHARMCNRLARSCDRGNNNACWSYEDRC
jgi:hypothetical protein